jgi:hypothetical protein
MKARRREEEEEEVVVVVCTRYIVMKWCVIFDGF